ncbi:unnamed protein product, partial [marine sediment metagenome]
MADISEKLKAVDSRFRHNSKQWEAARWIVRQDHEITTEERKALVQEIPIKYGSLTGLLTELRRMDLYPPQKNSEKSTRLSIPERIEETLHPVAEEPMLPLQEYATKEDFETLRNSINFLASVISGEDPLNPDENPGESEKDENIEGIQPEEMFIADPSLTRASVWLKPKTQMYFDMARQGVFANYAGTR